MTGPGVVRHLLVAVDGSASSTRALRLAADMAKAFGAELQIVHVGPVRQLPVLMGEASDPRGDDDAQSILLDAVRIARSQGVEAKVVRRHGRPADQIVRAVAELRPDLVVMGTRGLSRGRGLLLGSVSRVVVKKSKVQVVLVR